MGLPIPSSTAVSWLSSPACVQKKCCGNCSLQPKGLPRSPSLKCENAKPGRILTKSTITGSTIDKQCRLETSPMSCLRRLHMRFGPVKQWQRPFSQYFVDGMQGKLVTEASSEQSNSRRVKLAALQLPSGLRLIHAGSLVQSAQADQLSNFSSSSVQYLLSTPLASTSNLKILSSPSSTRS